MSKLDRYIEALQALRDGKEIQCYGSSEKWFDFLAPQTCVPAFHQWDDFRIKPAVVRYRVALFRNGNAWFTATADSDVKAGMVQDKDHFSSWISDWIEVEVSE